MDFNKTVIALLVIIIGLMVVGMVLVLSPSSGPDDSGSTGVLDIFNTQAESNLTIKGNIFYEGSNVSVRLTDSNGNPIANESLNISVLSDGKEIGSEIVKTDADGIAKFNLGNISEGNYSVVVVFEGNDKYLSCNDAQIIVVQDNYADVISNDPVSSDYDPGAFYSEQAGRTIYTGEIHDAPDGHKWKHLGNNEWVKID